MKLATAIAAALSLAACGGGGDEAPSCQDAYTAFYDVGCYMADEFGDPFPVGVVIQDCKNVLVNQPDECVGEFDNMLSCVAGVDANSCTDCTGEQDDWLSCL